MAETAATTNADTEHINKLRIDWAKAGNCWENPSDAFIGDASNMKHYVDSEILGPYDYETDTHGPGGTSIETYRAFSQRLKEAALSSSDGDDDDVEWTCERGHGILQNGCESERADIISYKKKKKDGDEWSCRVEYWEHNPTEGSYEEDNVCLLEATEQGLVLIVGCASSHPYVACNLLCFGNSDGSTDTTRLDTSSPNALIISAIALAEEYLYEQGH